MRPGPRAHKGRAAGHLPGEVPLAAETCKHINPARGDKTVAEVATVLGAQRRVINFASEAGGVFAEEVTFELDFERRALHKTKSGPRAKRFSLGNQCSHRGEGQPAAGWLPGAPCPEDRGLGFPRPREPASSLEAVLGLCLLSAIFSHWPERAPCSKQTPLVSAP